MKERKRRKKKESTKSRKNMLKGRMEEREG
jgi:hypothetical protein